MKTLRFSRPHKVELLCEELFGAFPEWIQIDPDMDSHTTVVVGGSGDDIELIVPDDADELAIQAVIDSHDPTQLSEGEKRAEKRRLALEKVRKDRKFEDLLVALGLEGDETS